MITVNDNDGRFEPPHIPEREEAYSSDDGTVRQSGHFYDFAAHKGVIFSGFSDEEGSTFAKSLRR